MHVVPESEAWHLLASHALLQGSKLFIIIGDSSVQGVGWTIWQPTQASFLNIPPHQSPRVLLVLSPSTSFLVLLETLKASQVLPKETEP